MTRPITISKLQTGNADLDRVQEHLREKLNPVLASLPSAADFRWIQLPGADATVADTWALQFRTTGTTWTTIATFDSTGALSQPRARAHVSAATSLPSGASTIINYNATDEDSEGAITTGASWKYTCKKAGLYAVSATAGIASSAAAAAAVFASIYINGNETLRGWRGPGPTAAAQAFTTAVAGKVRLAVNDTLNIRFFHNTGSTEATETAAQVNHFEIVRASL